MPVILAGQGVIMKEQKKLYAKKSRFSVVKLEERIAPSSNKFPKR